MRRQAILLCVLLAGCSSDKSITPPGDSDARDNPLPLEMSVDLYERHYTPGENLVAYVTISNPNESAITQTLSSGCAFGFVVLNRDDEMVSYGSVDCASDEATIELDAGESTTRPLYWRCWALPPGDYRLLTGLGRSGVEQPGPMVEISVGPRSTDPDLILNCEVAPTVVDTGDEITITLTIENPTGRAVTRYFPDSCTHGFAVWSDRGEPVETGPSSYCLQHPTKRTYEAGSTTTIVYHQTLDGLESGTYRVTAGSGHFGTGYSSSPVEIVVR